MDVTTAVLARKSVRAFRANSVPEQIMREIMEAASRSPSGGNLQPWRAYVVTGSPLEALKQEISERTEIEPTEYDVYPPSLWDPYRSRRFQNAEDLYGSIGISREDRPARMRQLARNAVLFDAPVGVFVWIDRKLGRPQWADLGMFMQSVMLLAAERGLSSCAQEFWSQYPLAMARHFGVTDDHMIFAGIAIGYEDTSHPVNSMRSSRADLTEWCDFVGFDQEPESA